MRLLLLVIAWILSPPGEGSSLFHSDGLKVTRQGQVQSVKDIYQVYVSVETPRFHGDIALKLGNLREFINTALDCDTCPLTIDHETKLHWDRNSPQ